MNPFEPVTIDYDSAESCRPLSEVPWATEFPPIDPRWLTETVIGLAEAIRESQDHSRLLILADALEDSGCENPFVLEHCRRCEHHHPECWVVSAILNASVAGVLALPGTLVYDPSIDEEEWRRYDENSPLNRASKYFEPLERPFNYFIILLLATVPLFFIAWGLMILWWLII